MATTDYLAISINPCSFMSMSDFQSKLHEMNITTVITTAATALITNKASKCKVIFFFMPQCMLGNGIQLFNSKLFVHITPSGSWDNF